MFIKTAFSKITLLILLLLAGISQSQTDSDFVEINTLNPHILLDIRYATDNNFLKETVYPEARCFLRYKAAVKLDSIQKELETIGLGLKIFDGYRPLSVQKKMWQVLPDDRYVANPANGSRHNRGAAVDLTLVDADGKELKMPTAFDSFDEQAHHDYVLNDIQVMRNRWILRTVMEKYGFTPISTEWWHYDLKGWKNFPVEDISFEDIDKKMNSKH